MSRLGISLPPDYPSADLSSAPSSASHAPREHHDRPHRKPLHTAPAADGSRSPPPQIEVTPTLSSTGWVSSPQQAAALLASPSSIGSRPSHRRPGSHDPPESSLVATRAAAREVRVQGRVEEHLAAANLQFGTRSPPGAALESAAGRSPSLQDASPQAWATPGKATEHIFQELRATNELGDGATALDRARRERDEEVDKRREAERRLGEAQAQLASLEREDTAPCTLPEP